jgi:hypothetical protein
MLLSTCPKSSSLLVSKALRTVSKCVPGFANGAYLRNGEPRMSRKEALRLMLEVTLIIFFLVGCGTTTPSAITQATALMSTPEPATPTPTPVPPTPVTPTDTSMPETVQPQLVSSNLNKIVFASNDNIFIVNVDNKELTRLAQVDHEMLCCARWSPDRQKIAFAIGAGQYYGLYVVNAGGSNLTRLTYIMRHDGEGPTLVPVWSQDGRQVDLVPGDYGYVDEDSSPDGQRVAFVVSRVENRELVGDLYVKNADGTDVTKLTTNPLRIWGIDW